MRGDERAKESFSVLSRTRQLLDYERAFVSCFLPVEGEVRADVSYVDSVRSSVTGSKESGRSTRQLI